MKTLTLGIHLAGHGGRIEIEVREDATVAEVLAKMGFGEDYCMAANVGQPMFSWDENLFDRVEDGQTVFVSQMAGVA